MKWVYGSGKARLGPVGGVLTDAANGIGLIEDIEISIEFDEEKLYQTSWLGAWPLDAVLSDGKGSIKFTSKEDNRNAVQLLTGGTITGDVLIITGTSVPDKMRLELDFKDSGGTVRTATGYSMYNTKYSNSLKRKGFAETPIELFFTQDSDSKVLAIPVPPNA